MLKRVITVIAAVAAAAAVQSAIPSAAQAGAYGCTGSQVGSWPVPSKDLLNGGTYYVSDIKLYYDSSTGWNCAALVKRPGTARYGVPTPMYIDMYNARWAEDNWTNNYDEDQGDFKYYAGPIKVYGKNMCVGIHAFWDDAPASGHDGTFNSRLNLSGVACG